MRARVCVYVFVCLRVCVQVVIGKLSSQLCKNENNNISLSPIYLLKLHDNILKYNKLYSFKEIAIGPQRTSEYLASLSDSLLV